MIAPLLQHAQGMSQHDRLDASMFWVGVMFAFLPLLIIGSGVAFLVYQRRKARTIAPSKAPAPRETRNA